jgi:DNA (cytosine-5)-methyltransferase 1
MKAIELFAGAGGAALGLEAAGVHHLALCEWNPDACATLRAAGLGPVVEGDVRDLDAIARTATERPDLLWSSFPCQAFSSAGKRLGAKDDRNGWPWTVAAIDRFQPRWFLAENVRGLLCHRGDCDRTGPPEDCPGCYFHRVILEELRERFPVVGWWLLDAADYGVPQHRRRVIIYAGPEPVTPPRATHGPGMFTRPWVSMGEALKVSGATTAGFDSKTVKNVDGPSPTITTEAGRTTPWTSSGVPFVLSASRNTATNPNQERPVPSWEPAPSIGGKGNQILASREDRRRLTVAECATLQGFEDHPWQGTKTAQYRQVGNAVPPKLAQVVVEAILEADRKP